MPANILDKHFGRFGNRMFQMAYIYAQFKEGKIPDIYIQDYRYFDKYREEIKRLFGKGIGELINKVAIHVRRAGNPVKSNEPAYSENPFYVNLSETDYYEKAMALFPNKEFLVFSDDPIWCEKQEIFKGCEISFKTEQEDFYLMVACEHQIIANSSYSWWAAYLNKNPEKKVIAPKAWYSDGNQTRTMLPEEWIKV